DGIRDFHVTGVQTCALPIFSVSDLQRILIEHMRHVRNAQRRDHTFKVSERVIIMTGCFLPAPGVGVEMFKLNLQDRGLKRIKPAVDTDKIVVIFYFLAMVGNHAELFSQLAVVGEDGATVAEAGEVLGWKK